MNLRHLWPMVLSLMVAGTSEPRCGTAHGLADSQQASTPARRLTLDNPRSVAVDRLGMVFIADTTAQVVWRVDPSGSAFRIGKKRLAAIPRRGAPAEEHACGSPAGVAIDPNGYLLVVDPGNNRVCSVNAAGMAGPVAGSGKAGFEGDGGPAVNALLNTPSAVATDRAGNIFIADTGNHCIRRVQVSTGIISTVAGNGSPGFSGDGGPASSASLMSPQGVAVDGDGNPWIADTGNNRIRRVDASSGIIQTVAGGGGVGFGGDLGPATRASLGGPTSVAVDDVGNLFIADTHNQRIRRVGADTGIITTLAGNGGAGFTGDDGQATDATLSNPTGLALDGDDSLYFADSFNQRVRRIDLGSGAITTVAGSGSGGGNEAPIADAGRDQILECTGPDGTLVQLDGSDSSAPDGAALAFKWIGPFLRSASPVTGMKPQVYLPLGKSVVRLLVNNGQIVSQPARTVAEIRVGVQPVGEALANLVPEGEAIPGPSKAWKAGASIPLELRLLCGSRVLEAGKVTPPSLVGLAGDDGPVSLRAYCAASRRPEATCLLFHYHGGNWTYDLDTSDLKRGTYLATIQMPDGRRFCATLNLQ